jgi:hypothetical protein
MYEVNENTKKIIQEKLQELVSIKCEFANFQMHKKKMLNDLNDLEIKICTKMGTSSDSFVEFIESIKKMVVPQEEDVSLYFYDFKQNLFKKAEQENEKR